MKGSASELQKLIPWNPETTEVIPKRLRSDSGMLAPAITLTTNCRSDKKFGLSLSLRSKEIESANETISIAQVWLESNRFTRTFVVKNKPGFGGGGHALNFSLT